MLGLPDMLGWRGKNGAGVGNYDTMGNVWGADRSQFYPGIMSAWSRIRLGWITPIELTEPGRYQLEAALDVPKVYKISHGFPDGEYLLLENRVKRLYDAAIPDEGLLVWHIDENVKGEWQQRRGYPRVFGWPGNGRHYQMAVLQADGEYELERGRNYGSLGDMYRRGSPELRPGPGTAIYQEGGNYPNTDSYSNGVVKNTGIRLSEFSDPGNVVQFDFEILPSSTLAPFDGDPDWWHRVSDQFTGVNLRRCQTRGGVAPVNGSGCSRKPKTCYFGTQQCAVGASPITRCYCDGIQGKKSWNCGPVGCPSSKDQDWN